MTMPTMMSLCQEIAFQHSEMAGFGWQGMIEKQLFWVLSRMKMEIHRYPVWNETIKISTWGVGTDSLQGYRYVQIHGADDQLLLRTLTSSLVVDLNQRKIIRIPREFLNSISNPNAKITEKPAKLPKLESPEKIAAFSVKPSDLDINQHVNNTLYVRWVLDAQPFDFLNKNEIAKAEINFAQELGPDENVIIQTAPVAENIAMYSILSETTGREACRLQISWRPIINA